MKDNTYELMRKPVLSFRKVEFYLESFFVVNPERSSRGLSAYKYTNQGYVYAGAGLHRSS
ncbi:MAG: hypothetical protein RIE52_08825 [Balneola sp.]|jgi:hypothetical protein